MTYLLVDLGIIAALIVFFIRGRKRGFVLSLCGFLAIFVAFIGAALLSNLLCGPVGRLVEPVLETSITETLQKTVDLDRWQLETAPAAEDGTEKPVLPIDQAINALKDSTLVKTYGESLRTALESGLLKLTTSAAVAIAAFLARELARQVLFLISFFVVLLAWTLLSRALDLAFRLPVLSTVNRGLGGVMGLVKGALLVFIAAWLLKGSVIPQEMIAQSIVLKFFCENSPLSLMNAFLQGREGKMI